MIKVPFRIDENVDVVVAAYKEDLSWLSKIRHPVFLYEKHPYEQEFLHYVTREKLENIGRESHTYLHHIIKYYDDLAPITVFAQGDPIFHCGQFCEIANCSSIKEMDLLSKAADNRSNPESNDNFCGIGHMCKEGYDSDWAYQWIMPYAIIGLEVMYSRRMPPRELQFYYGALMAISREAILKFRLDQYKELFDLHYKYWSFPWAMERIWETIYAT